MYSKIEIIEQGFEQLKPNAIEFLESFYTNLVTDYPQVPSLFPNSNMEKQGQKIWKFLELLVENLGKPDLLAGILKGLGVRYAQWGITTEHYPMVGNALFKTLGVYLSSSWTPAVKQAWIDTYAEITRLMYEGEQDFKQSQVQLIQIEKMSSLGRIVAGVAHEINGPVGFIYGNLDYISESVENILEILQLYQHHYPQPIAEIQDKAVEIDLDFVMNDLNKSLSSVKSGAERIREVIQSLRNFSQLDGVEMKPVNIHEGLDNTLLLLQHQLEGTEGKPEIQVIKEYGNLPLVECYAGQLNQVFMNILTNAIDVLESSENLQNTPGKITLRTELIEPESEQATPWVRISIADNGPGMSETVRSKIFDLFFTTKPVGRGTGLGLSISYEIIVKKHNGQLKCISAPGKGAEFLIEIPIQQRSQAGYL